MKKIILILFICSIILVSFATSNYSDDLKTDFKDLERSLKDFERSMELQKQEQLLKPEIKSPTMGFSVQDAVKTDRAMAKNEERFKKFLESQNRNMAKEINDWFRIPKNLRPIVDLIVIALFISILSFVFYKQKIKKIEKEKEFKQRE